MAIGVELTVLQQVTTIGFIYLAIKFIVWNKIFQYLGTLFSNKYTFGFLLIAIILAFIDPNLWDTYFIWLSFIIESLKSAVFWITQRGLELFVNAPVGDTTGLGWF